MSRKDRKINQDTFIQKKEDVKHQWLVFDATGKTLGRFSSEIAKVLRGKHKPTYTPSVDCGDGVIIINAEKIMVTGSKPVRKIYRYHTGHPGGLREINYETMLARKPSYIIESAVKGMVPRNRLGRAQMKRLRIFVGAEHNMLAQQPVQTNI